MNLIKKIKEVYYKEKLKYYLKEKKRLVVKYKKEKKNYAKKLFLQIEIKWLDEIILSCIDTLRGLK